MQLSPQQARDRFRDGRVARLATVRPDLSPHLVPVVFAVVGDTIYTVVDHKPKRSASLQRLVNLRAEPRCTLLVDAYHDDWSLLWWARADGRATLLDQPDPGHPGFDALAERYTPYRAHPPAGPLVEIEVVRWAGWAAWPDGPTG